MTGAIRAATVRERTLTLKEIRQRAIRAATVRERTLTLKEVRQRAIRAATVRERTLTLKEIRQRQIIVIVNPYPLSNVHRAQLGRLDSRQDVRRHMEVQVAAIQQILADRAPHQVLVGVVHL